jgi:hypothetical protein
MSEDARELIETAVKRFIAEVPALAPLTLIVGVELRGRGDTQQFRLQMPEIAVTKGPAGDARIHVEMRREFFNVMAKEAKLPDWIEAFTYGKASATGPTQYLRLISSVVDKQQERERARTIRKRA